MHLSATIDTTGLHRLTNTVKAVMDNDALTEVANVYIDELPKLYADGIGGDGATMEPYEEHYKLFGRERQGFAGSPKDLQKHEGRLHKLELIGDMVTVAFDTKTQKIALGQQTGGSGKWAYSNVMFGRNPAIEHEASRMLGVHLAERIR